MASNFFLFQGNGRLGEETEREGGRKKRGK